MYASQINHNVNLSRREISLPFILGFVHNVFDVYEFSIFKQCVQPGTVELIKGVLCVIKS